MRSEEYEDKVLKLFLDDLVPEEVEALRAEIEGDEKSRALLSQLEETVEAVQTFYQIFNELPRPPIPMVKRTRRLPFRIIATAAAILFLIIGGTITLLYKSGAPPSIPDKSAAELLAGELGWVMNVEEGIKAGQGKHVSFKTEKPVSGTAPGGPPGGAPGGPPGMPKRQPELQDKMDNFVKHFDFDFEIPREILADLELRRGLALTKYRLQLLYSNDDMKIFIFLVTSLGKDTDFHIIEIGKMKLLSARKSNIIISFHNLPENAKPEELAAKFIPH